MANHNNMIRMSGMNSGLDTEAIINAITANSKLKITKQNRQLLKYKATQEAYQDIIAKMQSLKNKYFDLVNPKSNLSGTSMWSQYATTTKVNGTEQAVSGFSATTTADSVPGNYEITVRKTATQASIAGSNLSSAAKFDFSQFTAGETYGITLSVGGESKNITFTAGATAEDTIRDLNEQLRGLYGDSNASQADPSQNGLVYVDANGQFISREGKGISLSGAGKMADSSSLDLSQLASGNNSIAVQIGDEIVNISFQTLGSDYFTPEKDKDGNDLPLSKEKQELLEQIKKDYIESKKYEAYQNWKDLATDADKEALRDDAFNKAEQAQSEKYFEKFETSKQGNAFLKDEYTRYEMRQQANGEDALSFSAWKKDENLGGKIIADAREIVKNGKAEDSDNRYYNAFKNYYYDRDISAELPPNRLRSATRRSRISQTRNIRNTWTVSATAKPR